MKPDNLFRNWKRDLMTVVYTGAVIANIFVFVASAQMGFADLMLLSGVSGALCGLGLARTLKKTS
jgi:hypothetical protein